MDDEDTIAAIAARRKPYRVHIEPNMTTTTTTTTTTMMDPTTFEQYNSPGLTSPPSSATSLMGQNENYGEEIGGTNGGIGGGIGSGIGGDDNNSSIRPSTPLPSQSPWLPILQSSNQLVLYNPYSHALTIMPSFLPPVLASTVRSRRLIRRPQRNYENEEGEDDEGEGEGGGGNVHGQTNLAGTIGGGGGGSSGGALTTVQNHNGYIMDSSTNNQARCPFCSRPFSTRMGPLDLGPEEEVHSRIHNNSESVETIGIGGIGIGGGTGGGGGGDGTGDRIVQRGEVSRRAPNYFQLLETSFEAQRRPPPLLSAPSSSISVVPSPSSEFVDTPVTPDNSSSRYSSTYSLRGQPGPSLSSSSSSSVPLRSVEGGGERARRKHGFGGLVNEDSRPTTPQPRFSENSMAQGYFTAFFKEEKRLGMGANGTVYLCQHILNGNYLGHFAVKKIAVGHSHEYLLRILKEVRLLETLRHPNIITYHHSWLETTRFSSFGPSIPTLHVLMEWAECGSLDDLIDARLGKRAEVIPGSVVEDEETTSRSSRIRAFKAAKHTQEPGASKDRNRGRSGSIGVHMLNAEEIKSFLSDIVSGLAFLHDRSILHLDLKMGNVLLTRDEERTIPRAMLSDFGTSQDALQTSRVRSGNTGTVEYSAPEALLRDQSGSLLQLDSKSDMWSLGMILHKLIFFRLPYPDIDASDVNGIEREVLAYPGWKATPDMIASCKRRGLPRATLLLLESLLNRNPRERPTSDRVLNALKEGMPETHSRSKRRDAGAIVRRRSSSSGETRSISPLTIRQSIDTSASHQSETIIPPSSPLISTLQNSKGRSLPDTLTSLLLPFPLQAYARMVRTRWRTLRSCLLVLKILSLSSVCQGAYPLLWVQSVLIACAVLDVWQENEEDGRGDLRVSFALLFIHFFILGIVRVNQSRFCLA